MERLEVIWHMSPDQRLFQLLYNLCGLGPGDAFHVEDDRIESAIDVWCEEYDIDIEPEKSNE
jgi:FMN phosphatase YigB (HAD superfamily)